MSLQSTATHPIHRSYVLKLHRDAAPAQGRISGRLEHIASGSHIDFASWEEMLSWLANHDLNGDSGQSPVPRTSP